MIHHEGHTVEITKVSETRIELRVFSPNQMVGEFFIDKLPETSAEEAAQSAYDSAYGKVGE
jgi:hypothetical protein